MLDEEQRRTVLELFSSGKSISEISRRVGVSRPSVYRVIASDVEKDAEILSLKKELRKTELRKRIRDLKAPIDESSYRGSDLERVIDNLSSKLSALWYLHPDPIISERPQYCVYCGEKMLLDKVEKKKGVWAVAYKCRKCNKAFPFP